MIADDFKRKGGRRGGNSRVFLKTPGGEHHPSGKCTMPLDHGTVLAIDTAGGGGWAASDERDPQAMDRDTLEGLQAGGFGE